MTSAIFSDVRCAAPRRFALSLATALALSGAATAQGTNPLPIAIPPAQITPPGDATPAQLTMRALLPADIRILHDSQGAGLVMYGALSGKASSALAVLQGVFTYSQAFDPIPALPLVVADQDDRHAQALFTASVHGVPVTGVAAVALTDTGGNVSVFYDHPEDFAASYKRLRQTLTESDGVASIVLTPLHLDDGSQIGIPPGWRLIGQGAGLVDLMGTQGEFVSLGAATPVHANPTPLGGNVLQGACCEPVKALQAVYPQLNANAQHLGSPSQLLTQIVESRPVAMPSGRQAAFVLAKLLVGNRPYSYFALVQTVSGLVDPWTLILSGVTAPQPVFAAEFPTLLQVWQSYSASPPGFADHLKEALQEMAATRQILQLASGPHQAGDYDASPAWGEAIAAAAKGGRSPIDDALAQKLADGVSSETGRAWRIVPSSELK
jgi:hypothetical protein